VDSSPRTTPTKVSHNQPAPIDLDASDEEMEEVDISSLTSTNLTSAHTLATSSFISSPAISTNNNLSVSMNNDSMQEIRSPLVDHDTSDDGFGEQIIPLHDASRQTESAVPTQSQPAIFAESRNQGLATSMPAPAPSPHKQGPIQQTSLQQLPAPSASHPSPQASAIRLLSTSPPPAAPQPFSSDDDTEELDEVVPQEPSPLHSANYIQDLSPPPAPENIPPSTTPLGESVAAPEAESQPAEEDWDAVQEIDIEAEEGDFANFASQVKGRNLADVRREIDDEIRTLNAQRKQTLRDSEEMNQQMVSQIMVGYSTLTFGIVIITNAGHATTVWYPLYDSAHGGGSAMRRTRITPSRRRCYNRRL
jgi:hypothetical protein